jgi:SAM-dependent methyltransferase
VLVDEAPVTVAAVAAGDFEGAFAAMRERYEGWLGEHGAGSSRAVGWRDPALQALRFELLAQVMEGDDPVTVADFGCGTGALFEHLAQRDAPPPLRAYAGYDVVPAMVEAARALHPDPRARFEVGTAVGEDVDYVLASGALSLRPGISDADWEPHLREVLRGIWERARRGLAFNLLLRGADPPGPDMYAGNPARWATWCSGALPGALVAVRAGPPLPDFAVLVRRG